MADETPTNDQTRTAPPGAQTTGEAHPIMSKVWIRTKWYFVFPVIAIMFLLFPFQWAANTVADWVRDQGVLYDPSREGLISVTSPQLFTRERLINQRLTESAWIDGRIAAVDDMIDEKRFAAPSSVSSTDVQMRAAPTGRGQQNAPPSETSSQSQMLQMVQAKPLDEFQSANAYRQFLVNEKFQSILDDAHDTSSNTLQRLNFNMTLSPARRHSTAVAAVSITIEEPEDPEWILQKYGELLFDVREELQQTAVRMIADRSSISKSGNNYILSGESEAVLREAIESATKDTGRDGWLQDISDMKLFMNQRLEDRMIQSFQMQLNTLGLDPEIGTALKDIFFSRSQGGPLPGSQGQERPDAGQVRVSGLSDGNKVGLSGDKKQIADQAERMAAQAQNSPAQQQQPPNISELLISKLKSTCTLGPTSIWALLQDVQSVRPRYQQAKYEKIEGVYANFRKANLSGDAQNNDMSDETARIRLREFLSRPNVTVPCPRPPAQLSHLAMLELLGDLWINPRADAASRPEAQKQALCTPAKILAARTSRTDEERIKLMSEISTGFVSPDAFLNFCIPYRHALLNVGIVRLVQAELEKTPIDTAGRVRQLSDYFAVQMDDCDIHSCQLIVRTKSEQFRIEELDNLEKGIAPYDGTAPGSELPAGVIFQLDSDKLEAPLLSSAGADAPPGLAHGTVVLPNDPTKKLKREIEKEKKRDIEEKALVIGRQEALRLFAELSCYASARSYTVYPREGLDQMTLNRSNRGWSVSALFGQTDAQSSGSIEQAEVSRNARILGIGDTGDRSEPQDRTKECSSSFLNILNNLTVLKDLTTDLPALLTTQKEESVKDEWSLRAVCILNHFVADDDDMPPEMADIETCVENEPKPLQEFQLVDLTASVRYLRQRKTTISWIVHPEDSTVFISRHKPRSIPLSAIVSVPSWWPGIQITTETCWLRPKRAFLESGRSLCPEEMADERITRLLPNSWTKNARTRARVESQLDLPLPYSLEDVLPKLGFFLIRYPYVDSFEPSEIVLESGREVKLRLTGKRLWKNPMVRIGEQWHSKVEVLPDMRGILATFECLAPLPGDTRIQTVQNHNGPIQLATSENTSSSNFSTLPNGSQTVAMREMVFDEERPVQVWTSEGKTQHVAVTVNAFRPRHVIGGHPEAPCWAEDDLAAFRPDAGDR